MVDGGFAGGFFGVVSVVVVVVVVPVWPWSGRRFFPMRTTMGSPRYDE